MTAATTSWRAGMRPLAGAETDERTRRVARMFPVDRAAHARRRHSHLGRMRADDRFIDGGAPTGTRRKDELAILDHIWIGQEFGFPAHLAAVQFHHTEVGNGR